MLILIALLSKTPVKSALVNWLPWSVLSRRCCASR